MLPGYFRFAEDRHQRQRLEQEERKRNDESLRQQVPCVPNLVDPCMV